MYPSPVQPGTPAQHPPFDRRLSYSNDHFQYASHGRSHYEPPRPLEPRPTLHSSFSDKTNLQRRQEVFHPMGRSSDGRGAGPSLPGLRDILSPGPAKPANSSYGSAWQPPPNLHSGQQPNHRSHYSSPAAHPPMILEPHTNGHREHQPRSFEVPIHQTSSATTYQPQAQSVPASPYTSYPPGYAYSPGGRYESSVSGSAGHYMSNAAHNPYGAAVADNSPLRNGSSAFEQYPPAGIAGHPAATTENQKKYIGVKDVPGEGAFHCYEGGYRIPTLVDGEQVNPAWGLTKANKPRKRLALACLDCREKKIKCEPGSSSCLQCEKAKRPCRRTIAQQSQSDTGSNTNWSPSAGSHPRKGASVSDPTPTVTQESELDASSKRRSREDTSPPGVPNKKQRSTSPASAAAREESLSMKERSIPVRPSASMAIAEYAPKPSTMIEDDPFTTNRDLALHVLDLYFTHSNNATYCLYPRHHVMDWVKTSRDKSHDEYMVLHAMLAVGSIFADNSISDFGKQCARIVMDVLPSQIGKLNMSMVHSKILLAIYSFSKGNYTTAWELSGLAIRAATYLRFHTEERCLDNTPTTGQQRTEFCFTAVQLAECKRRTFWSTFFMDRLSQASMMLLKPEDIFVRLPCTEEMYERGTPSDAPFLNNNIIDPVKALLTPASSLAPMAWHALVAAVWGDVVDFISRAPHRAAATYRESYESFYVETSNRLHGWLTRLPDHLCYSEANLDRSIQGGYGATFISMHALYHLSLMKLNRCLRHSLAANAITRNIRAAHEHGHRMLQMMCAVQRARQDLVSSIPFAGYATLAAVDIVSAGGSDSNLGATREEIRSSLGSLHELSTYWNRAKDQSRACERRYYEMQNIVSAPGRTRSGAWLGRNWGLEKTLESEHGAEDDCIYGLGDSNAAMGVYFDAFKDEGGHSRAPMGGLRIT